MVGPRDPNWEVPRGWSQPQHGWLVEKKIVVKLPDGGAIDLLPDDLITVGAPGEYWKECPGLQRRVLPTQAQFMEFKPVEFVRNGLRYMVLTA